MSANDTSSERNSLVGTLCRFDARISKWGYGISGWAGLLIGVFSLVVAEELVAALLLSNVSIPEALLEPLVLLLIVYSSMGATYHYRQRYSGPSCDV
jgi:hypothetical protein